MVQNTSYPSPTSAQMGDGPFYTRQNQLPQAADAQGSPQMPPRAPQAAMVGRDGEVDENVQKAQIIQNAQSLRHPQMPQMQLQTPQQLAQVGLESSQNYEESARKRTKVSRACDECRRKKIRCDADSEAPGAQCSSCKRSDMLCMFSRAPQKRGPSKGYIKELAERVGALEGRRMVPPMTGYQYPAYNEYSPQPEEIGYGQRKRTHSMSEGPQTSPFMPDPNPGAIGRESVSRYPPAPMEWSGREAGDTSRNATQASPTYPNTTHGDPSSNLIAPNTPTPLQRQENSPAMALNTTLGVRQINDPTDISNDWIEYALGEYYRLVHATHPLLPETKLQVLLNLDKVSDGLVRESFFAALQAVVKSVAPGSTSQQQDTRASQLLMALNFKDAATRTPIDNLVYLQAIIMMALTTDMTVPAFSQQPIWYSLAGIMSDYLALGTAPPYKQNGDAEIDFSQLARRAWLVFITLDRWHASSTLNRLVMAEDVTLLSQDDHALLGRTGFHLARLSLILGHISHAIRYPPEAALNSPFRFSLKVLNGELERFREEVEPLFASQPLVRVSFLHVKHLLKRALAHHLYEIDGLVPGVALEIVDNLCGDQLPMSPLTHHFACLAAITLMEKVQETAKAPAPAIETNEVILRGLHDLRQWLEKDTNPMSSAPESGKQGWNTVIARFIATNLSKRSQGQSASNGTTLDRGGLQHLAEAAVGNVDTINGEKDNTEEVGKITSDGDHGVGSTTTSSKGLGYLNFVR